MGRSPGQGDPRLHANASDVIVTPASTPEIAPLLAVLPLQLLSYHMSVLRGYDPDFLRNLSKTLTVNQDIKVTVICRMTVTFEKGGVM